jgi:Cof subfamily protein (haloacid dehalogenase superfamily)
MKKNSQRELNYPLIISDFDGTLVGSDGNIPETNKESIKEYVKKGGTFVISTGRMHYGILPRVRELGLDGFVSCGHGSLIIDVKSGEIIFSKTIPVETTARICEKMEELDLHFNVYAQDEFYSNKTSERLLRYEKALNVQAVQVQDRPLSQFVREKGICAYNVLAFVTAEDNPWIMDVMSKCVFEGCEITKSSDTLVEAVNASCSKGTALAFLAERLGISTEKVIAVGDQWNDLPMIERAGLGFAVNNANDRLKEKAIVLNRSNNEGAISEIIEEYAYSK